MWKEVARKKVWEALSYSTSEMLLYQVAKSLPQPCFILHPPCTLQSWCTRSASFFINNVTERGVRPAASDA